jgi:Putative zinc-finger
MTTAQAWGCTEARPSLGVYVLGAIDPAEHDPVDAHLATCPACRDEFAGLAGLPAFLEQVSPGEAARISADAWPSGEEQPRPAADLASARRRRARRRYLAAAAAAAAVIAIGIFLSPWSAGSTRTVVVPFSAGTGGWQTAQAASQITGTSATVAYARHPWGTAIEALVNHVPVGTTCQLWIVHPDGTRTQVAAWTAARDQGRVWYAGSMPSTAGPVGEFEITSAGRLLLIITRA